MGQWIMHTRNNGVDLGWRLNGKIDTDVVKTSASSFYYYYGQNRIEWATDGVKQMVRSRRIAKIERDWTQPTNQKIQDRRWYGLKYW